MTTQLSCSLCGEIVEVVDGDWAKNDVCPGCKLRTRHRAAAAYLTYSGNVKPESRIVVCHAAPEERRYLFGPDREILNFDVRPTGYTDVVMDIQDMRAIDTGTVDLFVALHVLNHVADDARALSEVKRVLKPETGMFIATVPVRRGQPTEALADVTVPYGAEMLEKYGVGSFRRYGLDDFRVLMERYFAVSEFRFSDPFVREMETVFQGRRLAA